MKFMVAIIVALATASGCQSTKRIDTNLGVSVIDYSANRRGTYLIDKDKAPLIISEPAPDVATEIIAALGISGESIGDIGSAELKAEYASKVVDLAKRSQTLQVLRESLFRLSEMSINTDVPPETRIALFIQVLETVKTIALTELVEGVPEDDRAKVIEQVATNVVDISKYFPK
jgi:type III secretion system FlhB-like substrate exporter